MKNKKLLAVGGLAAVAAAVGYYVAKKRADNENVADEIAEDVVKAVNPVTSEPGTSLETMAFLESMSPSLMTRDSKNQGAAAAASVLSVKGVSTAVEGITNLALGKDKSYANRFFTRAVIGFGGYYLSKLPEKDDESLVVSTARSTGRVMEIASLSGAIHDSLTRFQRKDARIKLMPIAIAALVTTGLVYRGRSMLKERRNLIDTVPEDPSNKIGPSLIAGVLVLQISRLIGVGIKATNRGFKKWLGDGPLKANVARISTATLWAGGAIAAYWAGVSKIGKANEKIEPYYTKIPTNPNVSGSKESVSSFEELGLQGRRYVTDIVDVKDIEAVIGKKAKNKPIRVYVGFNSDRKYHSARTEMALAELRRTDAFSRKNLLLVSPTGTGWIDQTMIESAELLTQGDIATCVVQYSKYPSFLSLQKVVEGRRQFRQLLWGVRLQLLQMPESKRPKVYVFGESLGAWSSSDTVMHTGIDGFDYYGIDRALWVGMPGLSKWGKIEHGETDLRIPKGTMQVFDRPDQFESLSKPQRDRLRAIILNHDNDPIAQLRPKMLVKKPKWLEDGGKGRGVPAKMEWSPIVTFIQVAIDAANAMRVIPGEFRSHGHDYRADMTYFVNQAYQFGASKATIAKVDDYLASKELYRANRSKKFKDAVQ